MTLKAIIVDDEELARERIRDLLEERPEIQVRAECRNGTTAIEAIRRLHPDLVFLDVHMPDVDGFGVIEQIGAEEMPPVIFVTAFAEHALEAFEANAVDYLLKPFDRERFQRAVDRVLERHGQRHIAELDRGVNKLLELAENSPSPLGGNGDRGGPAPLRGGSDRLIVRSSGNVHFVKVDTISWIEASRNYVKIHCDGRCDQVYTMRETMARMEARLDPELFLRIHRSTMVNIDRIQRIEPGVGTEAIIVLDTDERLMVSRAYRRGRVKELLS